MLIDPTLRRFIRIGTLSHLLILYSLIKHFAPLLTHMRFFMICGQELIKFVLVIMGRHLLNKLLPNAIRIPTLASY